MDALRELDAPDGVRVVVIAAADDPAERREQARAAARELVAELADVRAGSVILDTSCAFCGGDHGRPTALVISATAALPAAVSISHAGDLTVVAASLRERAIGIDAELRATRPDRVEAIGKIAPGRGEPMLRWTRIEAVLKGDGRGLRVDPRHVVFSPLPRQTARARIQVPGSSPGPAWRLFDLDDEELFVSLAVPDGD